MIRAWVKKMKDGTIDSSVASKKAYFQQKYTEQVLMNTSVFTTNLLMHSV